jgi:hypothetical protein
MQTGKSAGTINASRYPVTQGQFHPEVSEFLDNDGRLRPAPHESSYNNNALPGNVGLENGRFELGTGQVIQ